MFHAYVMNPASEASDSYVGSSKAFGCLNIPVATDSIRGAGLTVVDEGEGVVKFRQGDA